MANKKKDRDILFYVDEDGYITNTEDLAPIVTDENPYAHRNVYKPTTHNEAGGLLDNLGDIEIFQAPEIFNDNKGFWDNALDVGQTILGTAGDTVLNVVKGAGRLVEGVGDLAVYGGAAIADWAGNDNLADEWRNNAKESVVDQLTGEADEFLDKRSVLGRTSDSATEGLGQVAAIIATGGLGKLAGLSTKGVSALTTGTMFLSGTGSGMSEAYQEGATDEEAALYGAIAGLSDAASELVFGGLGKNINALGLSYGLSSADDMLAKTISSKFKNQIVKNLIEFGIKAGAEGFEEVLAGIGQGLGKWITYRSEDELLEILQDENLFEQFVVGAMTSGMSQTHGLHIANKNGTDFITGYSKSDQAVLDKLVGDRIAELEKDGKNLTNKEQKEIEAKLAEQLERGYISVETIEDILGKDSRAEYDALVKEADEFNKLYNTATGQLSKQQQNRLAELEAKNTATPYENLLKESKKKFSQSVFDLVKNGKLAESYREAVRAEEDFSIDENRYKGTKHEDAAKQTIQNAIKAGANNTNRVHDFVEMVAQTSADTGLVYDFKSNEDIKQAFIERQTKELEKLEQIPEATRTKEQSKLIDDLKKLLEQVKSGEVVVDGDITGNGIVLNLDSPKPLNRVVGHEVTHSLEQSKHYEKLRETLFSYAKSKGVDIDSKLAEIQAKYAGIETANPEAELVADLVGDYLFTDKDFVNHLSANNRNIFQKIYDEIKYLFKIATAGSQEARELEKVKKIFEDAYRQSSGNAQSGTKYSVSQTTDGRFVAVVDNDILSNIDTSSWDKAKKDEARKAASDALKQFKDGIVVDGITRKVNQTSRREYTKSRYSEWLYDHSPDIFADKMRAADIADDIVVATTNWNRDGGLKHPRKDNFVDFDHGTTLIASGDAKYTAEVVVGITNTGEAVYYDVVDMIPTTFDIKKEESPATATTQNAIGDIKGDSSEDTVAQEEPVVKTDYSLSSNTDSDGKQLSKEQQEFFKDSKVKDANGNLLKVYHGTTNNFTTFRQGTADGWGTGIYFTDNMEEASTYGDNVVEAYLNITNPYNADTMSYYDIGAEDTRAYRDFDMSVWKKRYSDEYDTYEEYKADGRSVDMYDIYAEEVEVFNKILRELGYDGIIATDSNGIDGLEIVAFRENQPKLTTNATPTSNPDIRYSLSKDSDGNQLSRGQVDFFKDSKARDANGNLLKVYHTTNNDFTVFDKGRKGETTGDYNTYLGFFFADTPEYMNQFPEFENGKTETYYLNMKNPIDMNNISKQAFLDIVEATGGDVQEAAELYDSEYEAELKRAKFRGDNSTIMEMSRLLEDLTGEYFDYAEFYNALKPNYEQLMSKGYDGIINSLDGRGFANEYIVLDSNQAKLTSNLNPTADQDVRYSLSKATDTAYMDAVNRGDTEAAFKMVEDFADQSGFRVRAYHGTSRGDRVGNVFLPERATSGPMAYFTSDRTIAENYSKSKQDTSMAYDPDYDRYETQFRIKTKYQDMPLYRAWGFLPFDARRRITEKAGQLRENWDGDNELILDPETNEANGGFQWQLKEARGNAIQALTEQWLNSGNLFNEESRFLDVLEMAGVTEEFKKVGMDSLYFKDPNAKHEKVYDTFLKINNPFDTATVDEQFVADLESWYEDQDQEQYVRESMESDLWDKNSIDAFDFANRLRSDIENGTTHAWTSIPDSVTDFLKSLGYDGIKDTGGKNGGEIHTVWIPFSSEQIKSAEPVTYDDNGNVIPLSERFNTNKTDIRFSMSNTGDQFAPTSDFDVYGRDVFTKRQDTAPVEVAPAEEAPVAEVTEDILPDDLAPAEEELESLLSQKDMLENDMLQAVSAQDMDTFYQIHTEYANLMARVAVLEAEVSSFSADRLSSLDDADAPMETVPEWVETTDVIPLTKKVIADVARDVRSQLGLSNKHMFDVRKLIEEYSQSEFPNRMQLFDDIKQKFGTYTESYADETVAEAKSYLRTYGLRVSDSIKNEIADYASLMRRNRGRIRFSNSGTAVDVLYHEMNSLYPHLFPESIISPTDQFLQIVDVANMDSATEMEQAYDDEAIWQVADSIIQGVNSYKLTQKEKTANKYSRESFDSLMQDADSYVPPYPQDYLSSLKNRPMPVGADDIAPTFEVETDIGSEVGGQQAFAFDDAQDASLPKTRKALHEGIVDDIRYKFYENGYDFDKVLKNAKNLSTFATVDNTPQRVMEKALGYKQGQILSDITVNKVAQNETEGIRWLNSFTDRKNGVLAQISKKYNIKPGSKESSAAQMYAEGFYVGENDAIIQYGDRELAMDFPNEQVQRNIKGLARDPQIRKIYDETLASINESRKRNLYPEIPRLDNYFLHFRAMEDTFSRLGLPFNPNDIRAKDLPTDLNGVTADLKPGQPYFASAKHRTGKRTSFDLLGGLERYLTSAKDQIYHIDDIQTLRALRNYIADQFGQAHGLENLDTLSEEEAQEKIEEVYGSHLSTFAKFLNEEANVLAGKTALVDRGIEGIIGRRGITFLNSVNRQVGSNMVGFNVSSSLTNFLPVVQTFAKTNKADFVKAFGQLVANRVGSVFGHNDGFTEASPVAIRRKGADRFHRTMWQKLGDPGYAMMGAVDDISTELIARTKYNELTRKGMESQKAHYETDKWVSRLMGDRSIGQQPQLFNSKMLGLFTKFQLEVRNQLDAQFYDTIQEAKVSTEDIENGLARNAKTAAKVGSTFFQLAVAQHLFGKAFESIAGYNPAFDIIGVMLTAFGYGDDDESEDTALDNIEQAFLELLEDLPYTSTFTGGRIPIASAFPIEELVTGKDQYGNEKSRWETLGETAPYYLMPGGYGQLKKTVAGLSMFDEDHPIAGSYTDSGNLRFPVDDTLGSRLQAGIFGQWASQNAQDYIDSGSNTLKDKQIEEFVQLDISIQDYWKIRKGLAKYSKTEEKINYINGLDLPTWKKNILANNVTNRKEAIDLEGYDLYGSLAEFDFAKNYPDKYYFFRANDISYEDYANADEDGRRAYNWAYENQNHVAVSKAVTGDFMTYYQYRSTCNDFDAKDSNGNTVSGLKKERVLNYINNLDLDYGQRIILYRTLYDGKEDRARYNGEILNYLNSRDDISYGDKVSILTELDFVVDANGNVTW